MRFQKPAAGLKREPPSQKRKKHRYIRQELNIFNLREKVKPISTEIFRIRELVESIGSYVIIHRLRERESVTAKVMEGPAGPTRISEYVKKA